MTNEIGRELLVYEWNTLFIRQENNSNSIEFTKIVMRVAYTIIHATHQPRIPKEGIEWLQFTKETRVGDLLLFKKDIVIRVYGFEGKTYQLPPFFYC